MSAADLLPVEPLSKSAFAPFGEVIAAQSAAQTLAMNAGSAQRYANLAQIDCAAGGGRAVIGIVRAQPNAMPIPLRLLERHPLGTQAFVPLSDAPYVVVVATAATATPRAFLVGDGQGISFNRGTWHHPLLGLEREADFLVIDRVGPGNNCEEAALTQRWLIDLRS